MPTPGRHYVPPAQDPTAKDQFEYRRGFARAITLPSGRQELTVNIAPVGAMYKRLVVATEGYASANVPIVHQAVAVRAAMDALDMTFQEDHNANFPPASQTIQ